jgi:hypothetical protein
MRIRSVPAIAAFLVAAAASLIAVPALAYTVGPGSSGTVSSGTAAGGSSVTATFTFVQPNGTPFPAGVQVTFSQQSGPSGCTVTFSSATATTDASGKVSVTVTLPANCPGQFVLAATAAGGGTVTATVVESGGFPNAAGAPVRAPAPFQPYFAIAAGLVLIGLGAFGFTRRRLQGAR